MPATATLHETRPADPDAALFDLIAEYQRLEAAFDDISDREGAIIAAALRDAPPRRRAGRADYWQAIAARNPDMDAALARHGMPELDAERERAAAAAGAAFVRILEYRPASLAEMALKAAAVHLGLGEHPLELWPADSWTESKYEPEFALAVLTRDLERLNRQPEPAA